MRYGCCTITWGGVAGDPVGVTSVKDLFYRSSGPTEEAITAIGQCGYEGVELFDGNLVDYESAPSVLRSVLQASGLELVSVYSGANLIFHEILEEELQRIERAARVAAELDVHTLVIGGGARRACGPRDTDHDLLAAGLERVATIAERHNLVACFHPHLTTLVESPEDIRRLFERSPIGFCPDTAHLAAGGGDPAELIREHGSRIRHVHLKDLVREPFRFVPLGQGELDFRAIMEAVWSVGYDGWVMVELDTYDGDPAEAAAISKRYVERLVAARDGGPASW